MLLLTFIGLFGLLALIAFASAIHMAHENQKMRDDSFGVWAPVFIESVVGTIAGAILISLIRLL